MRIRSITILALLLLLTACASVDVTKTGKGFYEPTTPAEVQILKTLPDYKYVELGTVTVSGFDSKETAKMHNAIRAKSSALGATAVVLTEEGLTPGGWGTYRRWATGVAIRNINSQ
ncbi:MAG: hypothetical protein HOJ79_00690 [Nitrospina sp.]|jgi:hypothetical protein|nr:hypothetical protein [Nitrospina sp.]